MREKDRIRFEYYSLRTPVEKLAERFKKPVDYIYDVIGKNKTPLTSRQISRIRDMYRQKIPVPLISRKFRVSASTVYKHLKAIKKHHPPRDVITPEENRLLKLQYIKGVSVAALSKRYRLAPETIYGKVRGWGIATRKATGRTKIPEKHLNRICRLRDSGMRPRHIAQEYGVSYKTIYRILKNVP